MMSKTLIIWILMIPAALYGQNDSPQLFEPTQIKADIDTLIFKLMDVHPTFSDHYKSNNLKSKIDSIKNSITSPMSSLDFFRIMQPIVTIDGHTSLRYSGGICPNEDSPLFPFKVIIFKNSLYIKENLSKNEALVKGTIIEKINGVSSDEIIRNLIRYIPGEKESYKIKRLERDFHVYMAMIYGSFSDFEITVNKTALKLKGADWNAFHGAAKPKFELRFYDDDIAYIYKRMFMPPKDFLHFMDSAFTAISERQINYLIIDNQQGSGLTDLADSLISYFADKPYHLLEKKATKISPFTKEFIESKKEEGYIQDGYFIQEYAKHNSSQKNRFLGSTYILTGPLSYSTATCFPAVAKNFENTFIVGEETGQPLLSNGDRNQFMLPETKMSCVTALSKVYMPGHNNDEINGVLPDFNVTPTLKDLLNDREYTLEYTLKLIRENKIKDAYFNQPLPGDSAVIFAPGIFSLPNRLESNITFSPDGKECYFGIVEIKNKKASYKIYYTQFVNNKWTEQVETPFSVSKNASNPFLSADGKRLYFTKNGNIWKVERTLEGWSEPQILPLTINSDSRENAYTETTEGVVYISSKRTGGFGGMDNWQINRLADQSLQAENLGPKMNSKYFDYSPFIAPDESYLIFGSYRARRDGLLYISFNKGNDEWTTPINMNSGGAKVNNTTAHHSNPSLSPDGKYLFFRRHEADTIMDVYWVSAKIIDNIKTQVFADISLKEELFKAVDAGDLAKVKVLIKTDPSLLEIKDQSGSTPLIRACLNFQTFGRQVEVAKILIEAGANVNVINNSKATALLRASVGRGPDYELIKLLIEKGADANIQGRNGIAALHWAVKYNDLKIAKFLLESGADINISNDYNGPISASTISGTVLQVAINYSQSNEMVKFVIENGAKLNIKDSQGNTELHLATLKGNTEQAKLLIEHAIDLNAKNNFNRTALYYAAKHGYRGVAELLIASGADKNTIAETNYGKAVQLSESLAEGEAYIWDLNFRYAVKTKNNLLVFTLGGKIGKSSESGLANGSLNANELKDQNITMFLRHRDYCKIDGKDFTELAKLTADVKMVSSFKPDFSKTKESEIPTYHLAIPNESFSVNGFKVHPIPALASGMGYLVEVDGLKIFHAGLHISDDKPEHIEKFRNEIDYLNPFGPIDIVMLSTHNHSNRLAGNNYEQYLYLIDQLKPKAIYLWGANVPEQYVQCAEFLKASNIPIVYPETSKAAGERFHYPSDKAQK